MSQPTVDRPTESQQHIQLEIVNTEQVRKTHHPEEVRIML